MNGTIHGVSRQTRFLCMATARVERREECSPNQSRRSRKRGGVGCGWGEGRCLDILLTAVFSSVGYAAYFFMPSYLEVTEGRHTFSSERVHNSTVVRCYFHLLMCWQNLTALKWDSPLKEVDLGLLKDWWRKPSIYCPTVGPCLEKTASE